MAPKLPVSLRSGEKCKNFRKTSTPPLPRDRSRILIRQTSHGQSKYTDTAECSNIILGQDFHGLFTLPIVYFLGVNFEAFQFNCKFCPCEVVADATNRSVPLQVDFKIDLLLLACMGICPCYHYRMASIVSQIVVVLVNKVLS